MNNPNQSSASLGHHGTAHRPLKPPRDAFTILEVVAVLGIFLLMAALAAPSVSSVYEASQLTNSTSQIASLLEQARAHAMANNTFVWVGFMETDASQDPMETPQKTGIGRVAMLVAAARSGMREYDVNDPGPSWSALQKKTGGGSLTVINKLTRFENLHMAASLGLTPEKGPMGLESGRQDVGRFYRIGHPACKSITPIIYPMGSEGDHVQFEFSKVINFDPHGIARIQYATNGDEIKEWMEIGLEATRGSSLPPETLDPSRGKKSAIQLDCMTGTVRIYTP